MNYNNRICRIGYASLAILLISFGWIALSYILVNNNSHILKEGISQLRSSSEVQGISAEELEDIKDSGSNLEDLNNQTGSSVNNLLNSLSGINEISTFIFDFLPKATSKLEYRQCSFHLLFLLLHNPM